MPDEQQNEVVEQQNEAPQPNEQVETPPPSEDATWEKRYNDLRPQWDRTNQENQQLREQQEQYNTAVAFLLSDDPALQQQAREWFGIEDEDESEEPDELSELRSKVEQMEQQHLQAQQAEQTEQLATHIESEIDRIAKESGLELGPHAREQVFVTALSLDPDENGNPRTEAAFKKVADELQQEIINGYIKSKKAPKVTPPGQSGKEKVDLSNEEERLAHSAAIFDAHMND